MSGEVREQRWIPADAKGGLEEGEAAGWSRSKARSTGESGSVSSRLAQIKSQGRKPEEDG